jgi:hypothetical protein
MPGNGFDGAAVDCDVVSVGINEPAGRRRALAIHSHGTGGDELVRGTPASDTGTREKAVQPFLGLLLVDGSISRSSRGVGR